MEEPRASGVELVARERLQKMGVEGSQLSVTLVERHRWPDMVVEVVET